jgi:hypothetical protein
MRGPRGKNDHVAAGILRFRPRGPVGNREEVADPAFLRTVREALTQMSVPYVVH